MILVGNGAVENRLVGDTARSPGPTVDMEPNVDDAENRSLRESFDMLKGEAEGMATSSDGGPSKMGKKLLRFPRVVDSDVVTRLAMGSPRESSTSTGSTSSSWVSVGDEHPSPALDFLRKIDRFITGRADTCASFVVRDLSLIHI